ncbi:SUF system NifU family Fe-S cluster assembly protein [Candidatus Micrarchaeota archaeon]|nr:SUF system NifU family Fe-S cluster assembly protein [Candidatus Micrarchaeota archaeon]
MDIYRENVLDHYKNPRNFGNMDKPDAKFKDSNPLCGDEVEFYLKIDSGLIKDVKYHGQGCAISQASASILSEKLIGMKISDVMKLEKEDVTAWLGSELTPSRLKCALLPVMVAKAAINEFEKK